MSESNNNTPTRITQLEEATAYEDGMYYAVAKAGSGTKKIGVDKPTPELLNARLGADGITYLSTGDAIRNQVTELKSNINFLEHLDYKFIVGLLDTTVGGTGEIVTAFTNRIATPDLISIDRDIILQIADGYRIAVTFHDSEGIVRSTKTIATYDDTAFYVIPKNQKFKLMIYKNTPETVDNISNYKSKVTFTTKTKDIFDFLENNYFKNINGENILYAKFVFGRLELGNISNGNYYFRVSSNEIMKYTSDITLTSADGFRFGIQTFDESGIFIDDSGWKTSLTISANTNFKCTIARTVEDTTEIANIREFVNAVTFKSEPEIIGEKNTKDIILSNKGLQYINIDFVIGSINERGATSNVQYSIRTEKCIKFDDDTLIRCNNQDYVFQLFKFNSETPSESSYESWYSGKLRGCYKIEANTYYVLCIIKDPLDTSEVADIETYKSKVIVYNDISLFNQKYEQIWNMPAFGNNRRKFVGHKGIISTYPENTTASFKDAAQHNIWGIETDIQVTKDGYLICMHDTTVDRTTDGTGAVIDLTLEQIRALHIDGDETGLLKVPTIEEYLSICKLYGCVAQMELKNMATNKEALLKLVNAVIKYGLIKQSMITCSKYSIGYLQTINTSIPCIFNVSPNTYTDVLSDAKKYLNVNLAFDINTGTLTDAQIEECHSYGIAVAAYIENNEIDAELLFGRGVDFVVTDILTGYQP